MFSGKIGLLDALLVAISSMLVVFTVLLGLFLLTKLMEYILREQASGEMGSAAAEETSEDEIAAVLMAAVRMYCDEEIRVNPMVRGAPRQLTASVSTADPMVRSCTHILQGMEQKV